VAVDVLPCLRVGVGQCVGPNTDHVAVPIMEALDVEGKTAGDERKGGPELSCCGELWARVGREWVEVDVVDGDYQTVADYLRPCA
jgi:hypothetical protein